jgi:transposase InsO family protein
VHPRPYKRTTLPDRFDPRLADLVARDFRPPAPNLTWVGDVTYIKTWAGWAFCATVIDCYSRKVVGFAVADHMRTDLIIDALRMAQYTSIEFRDFCRNSGVRPSVGRTGICLLTG